MITVIIKRQLFFIAYSKAYPKVPSFWTDLFNNISGVINTPTEPEPLLIILGVLETLRKLNTPKKVHSYCLITVKKITYVTKKIHAPTFIMWLGD